MGNWRLYHTDFLVCLFSLQGLFQSTSFDFPVLAFPRVSNFLVCLLSFLRNWQQFIPQFYFNFLPLIINRPLCWGAWSPNHHTFLLTYCIFLWISEKQFKKNAILFEIFHVWKRLYTMITFDWWFSWKQNSGLEIRSLHNFGDVTLL